MGAAAPIAAVALAVGGSLYSSFSQAGQLDSQARIERENARLAELQGAYREQDIRRDERLSAGEAIAAMGSNGIQLGTGSALDTLWQSAYERELAVVNARFGAAQEARSHRLQAKQLKKQASATRIGGLFRAGAAALSGMGEIQGMGGSTPSGSSFSMPVPTFSAQSYVKPPLDPFWGN